MRLYLLCAAAVGLAGAAVAQSGVPPSFHATQLHVQLKPAHATPVDPQSGIGKSPQSPGDVAPAGGVTADTVQSPPSAPAASAAQPDPGSRVSIDRHVVDAAGAFDGYMHRAARIDARFTSDESVARAVELGSVYEPRQLEEGAIAYAALVALQDPAFVEAIHEIGENPTARLAFVGRLAEHPETALDSPPARRAAARVARILANMGMNMVVAGAAVKQASYDLQSQAWSKQSIQTPEQRLARIEAESSTPISLAATDTALLLNGLVALRSDSGGDQEFTAVKPVVTHGIALAALAVLGLAGDDQEQQIAPLLTDSTDAECIKMARLNELQCLAVAGPQYEDIFCLGAHGMIDSGRCIASAAGMSEGELRPLTDQRSVFVPIAVLSQASERNPLPEGSRNDGVTAPTAAIAQRVSYSPYSGPVQP